MRLRLSLARTSRTYDRSPLWDPDPAHRVRLQPRRGHSGDSHVEEEQAIPRGADRRGREVLSAGLRWPPRRRSHAAQRRRLRVGHVAPPSPDCRSQRAIEDYASGQLPLPPPHMGEPRRHERHAADGRGSQPRARRHADDRETLRASRAVVYQRRDPRWRPTIRIQGGAEGRPNGRRIRSERRCAYNVNRRPIWTPGEKKHDTGWPNSENSKANRIEIMKGPAEYGQICSVGRRKIA